MKFLVGADYPRTPDSGAAGTVFQSIRALRGIGCEVDEFWRVDLGRRIGHGNLHYVLELPRAMRDLVAARCAAKTYDVVMISQPHAYLAAEYIRRHHPGTLFLNRSHGWEGEVDEVMKRLDARDPLPASPFRRWLQRRMQTQLAKHQDRIVEFADGLIVGCSSTAHFLQWRYALSSDRIGVIPEGTVESVLAADLPPPDPGRWKKILYVGQYTRIKAPEQVAAILNDVLVRRPGTSAGWICDAAHHETVRLRLDPAVQDRVTLHPWMSQAELKAVIDQYGFFLFPSWYEGFGKAPLEAMARGLVVLATRTGWPADGIRHGENGFLFEPGEAAAMGTQLETLLDDPAWARRIGAQARRDVLEITWTNHARQLVAFAERCLANKRRSDGEAGH